MPKTLDQKIHESEIAMLKAHARLEAELGKPPPLRRLAAELGYSDQSGAQQCLLRCVDHGLLKLIPARREITPKGKRAMRLMK